LRTPSLRARKISPSSDRLSPKGRRAWQFLTLLGPYTQARDEAFDVEAEKPVAHTMLRLHADLRLPEMDGFALATGVDRFMAKPFNGISLRAAVADSSASREERGGGGNRTCAKLSRCARASRPLPASA
jgi:hypothetical protein